MTTLRTVHEISVFLVVLWGILALLSTGQYNPGIISGCFVLLFIALGLRLTGVRPGKLFANLFAIAGFVFASIIAARTLSLLDSSIYLFLFLQVIKYFTCRTIRDFRWCYLISLFHVVGASVLTTSIDFALVFIIYIALMTFSIRLYILRGESWKWLSTGTALTDDDRKAEEWEMQKVMPRRMALTSALLTVLMLAGALVIFTIIPRFETRNFISSYGKVPPENPTTAFSDHVEFGAFEKIQRDSAVAMYVQPLTMQHPTYLRMRGVALDRFDGQSWSRTSMNMPHSGSVVFNRFSTRDYPFHDVYRVIQPPGITNYLFGETFPLSITLPSDMLFQVDPWSEAAWLPAMQSKEIQYETESMMEPMELRHDPADLHTSTTERVDINNLSGYPRPPHSRVSLWRSVTHAASLEEATEQITESLGRTIRAIQERSGYDDPESSQSEQESGYRPHYRRGRRHEKILTYRERCLSVPLELKTPRMEKLARAWTENEKTTFAKCLSIERHFHTDFEYSLDAGIHGNFIEDFLFRTRSGHCEYFATSMAILLRTLGIPARVVNGYYTTEWNESAGSFTVRQSDAHSWVEAYMGDYGWMTFDPTPPSGLGRRQALNPVFQAALHAFDALKVKWYRYIVDFDSSNQSAILQALAITPGRFLSNHLEPLFDSRASQVPILLVEKVRVIAKIAGLILLGIILAILFLGKRKRRSDAAAVSHRISRVYAQLVKSLGRAGYPMAPGQTPREFAGTLSDSERLHQSFSELTELYYHARYGGSLSLEKWDQCVAGFKSCLKSGGRRMKRKG